MATFSPTELIDPHSVLDNSPLELRPTTHWFLPMGDWQDKLTAYIDDHPEWKDNVKQYCRGYFDSGLQDRAMTRDLGWGVPVPSARPRGQGHVRLVRGAHRLHLLHARMGHRPGRSRSLENLVAGSRHAAGALHRQGQHLLPRHAVPGHAHGPQRRLRRRRQRARPTSS